MTWVLIVYLLNRAPIALAATSQDHCHKMVEHVKTLKGFNGASCLQIHTRGPQDDASRRD